MADEFSAGELRSLADQVEAVERAAAGMQQADVARVEAIPDLCEIYRNQIRGPLTGVRDIVCNPFVKRIIGSGPCTIIEQVIRVLDGVCPAP